MDKERLSPNSLLRVIGAVVSLFSLILGLLITFVSSFGYASVILLAALVLLFISGGIAFLVGQVLTWRQNRLKPA